MIIFFLLAITISFFLFLQDLRQKKVLKDKKTISFDKSSLNQWMNLTKKERYNLSKKDSASYLSKRKVLLDQIRKEYKIISKRDKKKLDS